ncbi:MAG: hypothetical protein WC249_01600 [Patescibacteria group bacterium]|jgi:hypothetical protein
MKNLFSVTAVLIIIFLLSSEIYAQVHQVRTPESRQIIIKNATKKLATQELANLRANLSFEGVEAKIFSVDELNNLAIGQAVPIKSWKFIILNFQYNYNVLPLIAASDVYSVSTYKSNAGVVKKIATQNKISPAEIAIDISLISFYLPVLTILILPLFIKRKDDKKLISNFIIFTDTWIFILIFLGAIISSIITNGFIAISIVLLLLIIVIMNFPNLLVKTIITSGIIIGTCVGTLSARLHLMGINPFSSDFRFIWEYAAWYVLAGGIGSYIMWIKKSPEHIYIE